MKFLLIEGDEETARLAERHLHALSADVECVRDGEQGMAILRECGFDCILAEPSIAGVLECIRRLRRAGYRGAIVAVSSATGPERRERGLRAGCDHYLAKPYTAELIDAVVRWIEQEPLGSDIESQELLQDVIARFVEDLPGDLRQLDDALCQEDYAKLERLVASLRGEAGAHGLVPIVDVAGELERMLHMDDPPDALKRQLDELVGICMRARPGG